MRSGEELQPMGKADLGHRRIQPFRGTAPASLAYQWAGSSVSANCTRLSLALDLALPA